MTRAKINEINAVYQHHEVDEVAEKPLNSFFFVPRIFSVALAVAVKVTVTVF